MYETAISRFEKLHLRIATKGSTSWKNDRIVDIIYLYTIWTWFITIVRFITEKPNSRNILHGWIVFIYKVLKKKNSFEPIDMWSWYEIFEHSEYISLLRFIFLSFKTNFAQSLIFRNAQSPNTYLSRHIKTHFRDFTNDVKFIFIEMYYCCLLSIKIFNPLVKLSCANNQSCIL